MLHRMAEQASHVQMMSGHLEQLKMRVESALEQSVEEREAIALRVNNEVQYAHSHISNRLRQLRNRVATVEAAQKEQHEKHRSRVKKDLSRVTKDMLQTIKHHKQ